jgi:hypothetical protein
MGRLSNSWSIFKQSLGVIKKDKELLFLPVISGISSLAIFLSFVFPAYYVGLFEKMDAGDKTAENTIYAMFFAMYLILSFVTIYFQAALISAANERLGGGDPTVASALRGANKRLGKIFVWSLIAATVSLLIQMLEAALRRAGNNLAASILGSLLGTAWTLMTYFVIPVVLFEERGPFEALKRSGSLFKQRWGESLVGEWGIGFIMGVFTFLSVLGFAALLYLVAPLGFYFVLGVVVAAVMWLLFLTILGQALGGVYKTALYRYAKGGEVSSFFEPQAIQGAYRPTYVSADRM